MPGTVRGRKKVWNKRKENQEVLSFFFHTGFLCINRFIYNLVMLYRSCGYVEKKVSRPVLFGTTVNV